MDKGQLRFVGTIGDITPTGEGDLRLVLVGSVAAIQSTVIGWQPAAGLAGGATSQIGGVVAISGSRG